jgi:bacterioferritin-associated ferredoxin
LDLDKTICHCFHVPLRKIVQFVKQTRPKRPSQISECFGAGSGCGWCIPELLRIYRQVSEGEAVTDDELSPEEYAALRSEYLRGIEEGTRERHGYGSSSAAPGDPPGQGESGQTRAPAGGGRAGPPDGGARKPGDPTTPE